MDDKTRNVGLIGASNTNDDQQSYAVSIDGHSDFTFSGEPSLLQAMSHAIFQLKRVAARATAVSAKSK